jgi:FlaA1/EpsC-like NDP-sugar epimerase
LNYTSKNNPIKCNIIFFALIIVVSGVYGDKEDLNEFIEILKELINLIVNYWSSYLISFILFYLVLWRHMSFYSCLLQIVHSIISIVVILSIFIFIGDPNIEGSIIPKSTNLLKVISICFLLVIIINKLSISLITKNEKKRESNKFTERHIDKFIYSLKLLSLYFLTLAFLEKLYIEDSFYSHSHIFIL